MKVRDKVLVVTGGGSGIGRELVLLLLKKGAKVAAVDLNESTLQETAQLAGDWQTNLSLHVVNVADKSQVDALPEQVIQTHGQVDGIINNAGIIQPFVPVKELDLATIERVMNVNFYGVLYMTQAFLPHLLKRPVAHILNVSSMGGFLPVPGQTVYGASKAAVKLFTEGLHTELMDTPVRVTIAFPGAVQTNITTSSGLEVKTTQEQTQAKMLSADKAAEIIINAMEQDKYRVLVGKDAKFMDRLYRLHPKRAAYFIYRMMKKYTH